MKKLFTVVALTVALALVAKAAEGEVKKETAAPKKPAVTAEQKALRKELIEKYDANKNGRLDKAERSKMTPEDSGKWSSVTPAPKVKKAADAEKKSEPKP